MIKQWTNDKGVKYLFVSVPVDAYDFVIRQADRIYESHNQVLAYKTHARWERFKKENWNWSTRNEKLNFIGLTKDLTEVQRINIVDEGFNAYNEPTFKLYGNITVSGSYVATALESLSTLIIQHLGFKESDNVAILEVTG